AAKGRRGANPDRAANLRRQLIWIRVTPGLARQAQRGSITTRLRWPFTVARSEPRPRGPAPARRRLRPLHVLRVQLVTPAHHRECPLVTPSGSARIHLRGKIAVCDTPAFTWAPKANADVSFLTILSPLSKH